MNVFCIITIILHLPVVAGVVAKKLGRSFWFWLMITIPLQTLAFMILLCLPIIEPTKEKSSLQKDPNNEQIKKVSRMPAHTGSR